MTQSRFPLRIVCAALLFLLAPLLAQTASAQGDDEVTPEVQTLYQQARAARQSGDNASAIDKYKQILKLAPHLAAAYNNLGMVYFDTHQYPEAIHVLERGLQLNPKMPGS